MIQDILAGFPVGMAMDYMSQRYAKYATTLTERLRSHKPPKPEDDRPLAELWLGMTDARNFLVLGDPAVRSRQVSQ